MASSAVPHCPAGPFCNRSKSSNKAKFFFKPQTPESPIFEEELNEGEERKKNLKHIPSWEVPQTSFEILNIKSTLTTVILTRVRYNSHFFYVSSHYLSTLFLPSIMELFNIYADFLYLKDANIIKNLQKLSKNTCKIMCNSYQLQTTRNTQTLMCIIKINILHNYVQWTFLLY